MKTAFTGHEDGLLTVFAEVANRNSFIDFVHGLLSLNPLERWSPQQAKMHPFITQQKFTGPFIPPMNLKAGSATSTRSPAPGVQQQQQAEAVSKQRQQAQHAVQVQAQTASNYAAMQMQQFQQPPQVQVQPPVMYNTMYGHQGAPPPYPTQAAPYPHSMSMMQAPPPQIHYGQQPSSLHAQATARAGRQRATTMDQQQSGIPPTLQRVVSHLDPNQPIRLQPSPAYYPPPADLGQDMTPSSSRRRASRAGGHSHAPSRGNRELIRNLEDRSIEEGYMMGTQPWH